MVAHKTESITFKRGEYITTSAKFLTAILNRYPDSSPEKQEFYIKLLSKLPVEQVLAAVDNNYHLSYQLLIGPILTQENNRYRSGKSPRREAKVMSLVGTRGKKDLASLRTFDGQLLRTKETEGQLAQIVKICEVQEALVAISNWFDDDKRGKAGELIAEITDLYYNLIHLRYIDSKSPESVELCDWIILELNKCLGWSISQALSLVTAKYFTRMCKYEGKNAFESEYEAIGFFMHLPDVEQDNVFGKMRFPNDEQLKELFTLIETNSELLLNRYEQMKDQYDRENTTNNYRNNPATNQFLLDL